MAARLPVPPRVTSRPKHACSSAPAAELPAGAGVGRAGGGCRCGRGRRRRWGYGYGHGDGGRRGRGCALHIGRSAGGHRPGRVSGGAGRRHRGTVSLHGQRRVSLHRQPWVSRHARRRVRRCGQRWAQGRGDRPVSDLTLQLEDPMRAERRALGLAGAVTGATWGTGLIFAAARAGSAIVCLRPENYRASWCEDAPRA